MAKSRIPALLALGAAMGISTASAQQLQPLQGQPISGLSAAELVLFEAGAIAFGEPLTISGGLGPIFNEQSCGACHNQPATGGHGSRLVTRFGLAANGGNPFDDLGAIGGSLLQDQAIDVQCQEVIPGVADVIINRATPTVFGIGLIEAIPDSVIVARANNQPPGINGQVRMNQPLEDPMGPMRVGRFGWKGGVSTVDTFSIDAAKNEMGLTSQFSPTENAPNGNQALLAQWDTVADPEDAPDSLGFTFTDRITHFQQWSAPPPQMPTNGHAGAPIFDQVGCADCHVATYTTGTVASPALSGVEIHPYSDFLLHDMGALGDGIVDGQATETIMMTRTLWGLSNRTGLLHDTRSTGGTFEANVENAIGEHQGEGLASNMAYNALSQGDKDLMLGFLATLGQGEFDFENDNDIDVFDWFFIEPFLNGPAPAVAYTPEDVAAICDIDQDGDFDIREFGIMQRAWTGE
ncbi:MAG: hypothetical protein ACI8QC_001138 [Planctomycetota bacterium]|jgi:hypothetical protein